MYYLQFYRNNQRIFTTPLHQNLMIGRSDRCDVALPSADVSRTHCRIYKREDAWFVQDCSKHGITVNSIPCKVRKLQEKDTIGIMDFSCVLLLGWDSDQKTAQSPAYDTQMHIMSADNELHSYSSSVMLLALNGEERTFALSKKRTGVGAKGSDLEIEDSNVRVQHCYLHTARGRVMVEPGEGPVMLDGQPIQGITPVYPEDELRIGQSFLRVVSKIEKKSYSCVSFGSMKSASLGVQKIFGVLDRFAHHQFHVLLLGESGTGKELAARAIHQNSPRKNKPFVVINCGAIPRDLIESELFGHERGAFTGALGSKLGVFQQANGGTLFLDELGELPLDAQTKLLRVLESGEVRRVGGSKVEYPNVRIIAATNRNLTQEMEEGAFRADLYYRISCLSVMLPPLRERLIDVPILAQELLSQIDPKAQITDGACQVLCEHSWPGNIRELKNVLIRSYVLSGDRITRKGIQLQELHMQPFPKDNIENEEKFFVQLLKKHNGNRSAAARALGISRTTFLYRLKRYGLS